MEFEVFCKLFNLHNVNISVTNFNWVPLSNLSLNTNLKNYSINSRLNSLSLKLALRSPIDKICLDRYLHLYDHQSS